jgi:hypothetical protein
VPPAATNAARCTTRCRHADEAQISHLRAQLLRSEQDNELMRIKLEQETAEREKAQKQVGRTVDPLLPSGTHACTAAQACTTCPHATHLLHCAPNAGGGGQEDHV